VLARLTGRARRASTVALVALVGTQLGQTLLDSRSPLVVLTAGGSLLAMAAVISTPGLSQLLGCTPLGPIGWGQALGTAAVATTAPRIVGALTRARALAAPEQSPGEPDSSTIPAWSPAHNGAEISPNGTRPTQETTLVNGSAVTPSIVTTAG
jgi:cation-transporting P-type ATPase I